MKRALIAAVVVVALGGATAGLLRGAAPAPDDVATYTVARASFVRRVTAEGNLRAVKATRLSAPRGSGRMGPMKIAWLAADGTLVKAGEVVVRFDSTEYDKQLRDGQADLDSASAKLRKETVKSGAAVAGRDSDAVLARDELDRTRKFQSKDQMIFSRNQIIESEVDEQLAGAKQTHAENAKQIERHLSVSNAAVIAVERKKAELAISHAEAALKSMAIVAPSDGIFVLQRNWRGDVPKLGEQMWPGQPVAEIPLLESMEAEVFVLEIDGSGLAEKQKVELVIEARPDVTYQGKIKLVDKLAKPRIGGVPIQYFAVVVALDKTDPAAMKPGQRVRARLLLDDPAAATEQVVVPRQAVLNKDGKNFVYRRTDSGEFEQVAVELGAATSGRVVVKTGLSAGDSIALRDPTRSLDQHLPMSSQQC